MNSPGGIFSAKLPLRTMLVLPFMLIIVGTAGLVGYYALKSGHEAVHDVANQLLEEVTAKVERALPVYLNTAVRINMQNTLSVKLGKFDLADVAWQERYFWSQLQIYDSVTLIGIGRENVDNLAAERYADGSLAIRTSSKASGWHFHTYLADAQGRKVKLLHTIFPFDPRKRPWYKAAVQAGRPVWSPIFPNTAGITSYLGAVMPFYDPRHKLLGVFVTNISLGQIGDFLKGLKIGKTGQAFIIERSGLIVATSTGEQPFTKVNKTYGAVRIHANQARDVVTRETGRFLEDHIKRHPLEETLHRELDIDGEKQYLVVRPFRDQMGLDWLIAVVVPEDDFMEKINANIRNSIWLCLLSVALAALIGTLLTRRVTLPLQQLTRTTRELAAKDFQADAAIEAAMTRISRVRSEEVSQLATSFIEMASELETYIVKVRDTTAAKERAESELRVGREIQMSALPRKFPPFPKRTEFELHAHIEPAKEMSGDFYDFYLLNERLYFTIGDVSGKGVPASLFMVTCRTLLEAAANQLEAAHEILDMTNRELRRKNKSRTFVTVFYGVLDLQTGVVTYANAGHNPPYVLRGAGRIEELARASDPVLGVMPGIAYGLDTLTLAPGAALFLYTDGVTEAMDAADQQFTPARLEDVLRRYGAAPLDALLQVIMDEVNTFTGDAPQSDDITMLAVRYRGPAS